ncbi:MAG: hypothetical protein JWM31_2317, partial [Solirubrobacterales bacterium]|nr:hypothetical protein [Solirubrobacterales bacterium]
PAADAVTALLLRRVVELESRVAALERERAGRADPLRPA